eukprot:362095-Chlamydomonas_euryale.AAC.3
MPTPTGPICPHRWVQCAHTDGSNMPTSMGPIYRSGAPGKGRLGKATRAHACTTPHSRTLTTLRHSPAQRGVVCSTLACARHTWRLTCMFLGANSTRLWMWLNDSCARVGRVGAGGISADTGIVGVGIGKISGGAEMGGSGRVGVVA